MRNLKPASLPLMFVAAMLLLPATNAAAHERGHRSHAPPSAHFAYRQAQLPRWLRRNYDFIHWYRINYFRFGPDVRWKRLHRRYQRDYFYHRHYKKRHGPNKRKQLKKQKRHRNDRRRGRRD